MNKPIELTEQEAAKFKVYSTREAADILKLSFRTVQQYVKSGRIKAVKIGKEWRISEKNLLAFINGD